VLASVKVSGALEVEWVPVVCVEVLVLESGVVPMECVAVLVLEMNVNVVRTNVLVLLLRVVLL
jgi:hypothetical protein